MTSWRLCALVEGYFLDNSWRGVAYACLSVCLISHRLGMFNQKVLLRTVESHRVFRGHVDDVLAAVVGRLDTTNPALLRLTVDAIGDLSIVCGAQFVKYYSSVSQKLLPVAESAAVDDALRYAYVLSVGLQVEHVLCHDVMRPVFGFSERT
jgi:hypothetical protein